MKKLTKYLMLCTLILFTSSVHTSIYAKNLYILKKNNSSLSSKLKSIKKNFLSTSRSKKLKINTLKKEKNHCAVITALKGSIENTLKKYTKQELSCDFIAFVDKDFKQDVINNKKKSNGWILDSAEYHKLYPAEFDNEKYKNSLIGEEPKDIRSIYKFYKLQYYRIPRLNKYDAIIWIDATREIIDKNFTEIMNNFIKQNAITAQSHYFTYLEDAKAASKQPRFTIKGQNIMNQYNSNIKKGFPKKNKPFKNYIGFDKNDKLVYIDTTKENPYTKLYKIEKYKSRIKEAHWQTNIIGFNNKYLKNEYKENLNNVDLKKFLDTWYMQKLEFTTFDQLGFTYSIWENDLYDNILTLDINIHNKYVKKHNHNN